jgi:transcriptional regulator with XRE-family HTH domain
MDAPHALKIWIEANTTQAKFAREHSISEGYLSDILAGRKTPTLTVAARLSRATGGIVPLDAFVRCEAAQ